MLLLFSSTPTFGICGQSVSVLLHQSVEHISRKPLDMLFLLMSLPCLKVFLVLQTLPYLPQFLLNYNFLVSFSGNSKLEAPLISSYSLPQFCRHQLGSVSY